MENITELLPTISNGLFSQLLEKSLNKGFCSTLWFPLKTPTNETGCYTSKIVNSEYLFQDNEKYFIEFSNWTFFAQTASLCQQNIVNLTTIKKIMKEKPEIFSNIVEIYSFNTIFKTFIWQSEKPENTKSYFTLDFDSQTFPNPYFQFKVGDLAYSMPSILKIFRPTDSLHFNCRAISSPRNFSFEEVQ